MSEPPSTPTPTKPTEKKESVVTKVTNSVKGAVTSGVTPTSESEKVSANAKVVVLGLFGLVAFLMLMFTITATASEEVSEQMTTVFTGAIAGAFTLGGVLITQIWGKNS